MTIKIFNIYFYTVFWTLGVRKLKICTYSAVRRTVKDYILQVCLQYPRPLEFSQAIRVFILLEMKAFQDE
jgi:hypothetical protein